MAHAAQSGPRGRTAPAVLAGSALMLCAASGSADFRNGVLGAPASYADYYQITCFDDGGGAPASLSLSVSDLAPVAAPLVSAQIQKGNAATNGTDEIDGDAGSSPFVWVNGAAGIYDVFVDKTDTGVESYELSYQCTTGADGSGASTGATLVPEPPELPGLLMGIALIASLAIRRASARGALRASGALAIALWLVPGASSAHTQNGSLGATASATDYYQITCSDDGTGPPASLAVEVMDAVPAGSLVSVQIQRGSALTNVTDAVDGDASASPPVWVNGGAGVYDVLVDKSSADVAIYTLDYHCYTGADGTGDHTGTSLVTRQNQ